MDNCEDCVQVGQVNAGDQIGEMILTFNSNGAETTHLHLEYGNENLLEHLEDFIDNAAPEFDDTWFDNGIRFNADGLEWQTNNLTMVLLGS